ncbi:hypothetical protein [Anaerovibrio lipolyticus]|uniref:hypothetical protein n=1 Tax=Anaerovibrio lipolyticus TaxID=82374 RepID=UPI0026F17A38|nr:hypothetical protein [Anaerovibrio lipolyticus]MBE6105319.1 hypothetical protein [Anaerovibrio lipolyticus]
MIINNLLKDLTKCVLDNVYDEISKALDDCNFSWVNTDENLIMGKEIYLDTSSLMCKDADAFLVKYIPYMEQYGKRFNTLSCCIREINKHLKSNETYKRAKALIAKERIDKLLAANLLNVIDYSGDVFADADFISYFNKKRINEEVLFVSQDGNLSVDVYRLNEMQSVHGHEIMVRTIGRGGELALNSRLENFISDDKCNEYDDQTDFTASSPENQYENDMPQTSTNYGFMESIERGYGFLPDYNHKYSINGIEANENEVVALINNLNNAAATGEIIV